MTTKLIGPIGGFMEKKFGETVLNLKTEGLNIYSSTELINKSSMKQLIEISNNIINYVKIFLICLRYRKKIMKIFLESVSKIIDFETDNLKDFNESKKEFINQCSCCCLSIRSSYSNKCGRNSLFNRRRKNWFLDTY